MSKERQGESMKKILFFGDSITDMRRSREENKPTDIWSYGSGYPIFVASDLYRKDPNGYEVINRGIGGNRVVDLYARIKAYFRQALRYIITDTITPTTAALNGCL